MSQSGNGPKSFRAFSLWLFFASNKVRRGFSDDFLNQNETERQRSD